VLRRAVRLRRRWRCRRIRTVRRLLDALRNDRRRRCGRRVERGSGGDGRRRRRRCARGLLLRRPAHLLLLLRHHGSRNHHSGHWWWRLVMLRSHRRRRRTVTTADRGCCGGAHVARGDLSGDVVRRGHRRRHRRLRWLTHTSPVSTRGGVRALNRRTVVRGLSRRRSRGSCLLWRRPGRCGPGGHRRGRR